LLCLGLALLAGAGHAACSRVLDTPVAPTGRAVVVEGDEVSGVYPGLLRAAQAAG
jgi:polar amino acid transport system substrate-binding protein